MSTLLMSTFITKFSSIGHTDQDSEELKIHKSFLVFMATFMSSGGVLWGTLTLVNGIITPSLIPYGYVALSIINISILGITKKFPFVRVFQVFISLFLPIFFQWSLGGFMPSGGIILWSVLALVASLSFGKFKNSLVWLVLFIAGCTSSYLLDEFFYQFKPAQLPDASPLFLFLNVTIISSILFGLVMYFVSLNKSFQLQLNQSLRKIAVLNKDLKQKYQQVQIAQIKLREMNKELQISKEQLTEMTQQQTAINQMLLKERKMI